MPNSRTLPSACRAAAARFAKTSGWPTELVSLAPKARHPPCPLCRHLGPRLTARFRKDCADRRRQAVLESFRWGEPFLTTCPLGLLLIAVPAIQNGQPLCGLVTGFGLFPEIARDVAEELRDRLGHTPPRRALQNLPRIPKTRALETGRRLLSLLAAEGLTDPALLEARRQEVLNQKRIAEVMAELRGRNLDLYTLLADQREELLGHLRRGDRNAARELLNRILGALYAAYRMDPEMLKIRLIELVLAASRAAIDWGAPPREWSRLTDDVLLRLNRSSDLFDLSRTVAQVLETYISRLEQLRLSRRKELVNRMRDLLHRRFAERISTADLGAAAGLHPCHALRLFKEETGLTPHAYLLRLRLAKAKDLLASTRLSMAEIAQETGFFDQSHFTRTFRRFEHTTPLRYRKERLNPPP